MTGGLRLLAGGYEAIRVGQQCLGLGVMIDDVCGEIAGLWHPAVERLE